MIELHVLVPVILRMVLGSHNCDTMEDVFNPSGVSEPTLDLGVDSFSVHDTCDHESSVTEHRRTLLTFNVATIVNRIRRLGTSVFVPQDAWYRCGRKNCNLISNFHIIAGETETTMLGDNEYIVTQ